MGLPYTYRVFVSFSLPLKSEDNAVFVKMGDVKGRKNWSLSVFLPFLSHEGARGQFSEPGGHCLQSYRVQCREERPQPWCARRVPWSNLDGDKATWSLIKTFLNIECCWLCNLISSSYEWGELVLVGLLNRNVEMLLDLNNQNPKKISYTHVTSTVCKLCSPASCLSIPW